MAITSCPLLLLQRVEGNLGSDGINFFFEILKFGFKDSASKILTSHLVGLRVWIRIKIWIMHSLSECENFKIELPISQPGQNRG